MSNDERKGGTQRRSSGKGARAPRPDAAPASGEMSDAARDLPRMVQVALAPVQVYGLIVSSDQEGVVALDGAVRTDQARRNAEQLACEVPGVRKVVNRLNLNTLVGSMPVNRAVDSPELAAEIELTNFHVVAGTEDRFNESIGTTDTAIATDEAIPYFAPTDPPTRRAPRREGGYTVVGGFSETALDTPIDLEQLPRALTDGDDEIARRVRLALKEDAGTADLPIHVVVRRGVVRLRGAVPSLTDAELAEEVASRAPGVLDVEEKLDVVGL
ncbi:MAG: BON domain-containing protein [Chloroflexota bacterium]